LELLRGVFDGDGFGGAANLQIQINDNDGREIDLNVFALEAGEAGVVGGELELSRALQLSGFETGAKVATAPFLVSRGPQARQFAPTTLQLAGRSSPVARCRSPAAVGVRFAVASDQRRRTRLGVYSRSAERRMLCRSAP